MSVDFCLEGRQSFLHPPLVRFQRDDQALRIFGAPAGSLSAVLIGADDTFQEYDSLLYFPHALFERQRPVLLTLHKNAGLLLQFLHRFCNFLPTLSREHGVGPRVELPGQFVPALPHGRFMLPFLRSELVFVRSLDISVRPLSLNEMFLNLAEGFFLFLADSFFRFDTYSVQKLHQHLGAEFFRLRAEKAGDLLLVVAEGENPLQHAQHDAWPLCGKGQCAFLMSCEHPLCRPLP